MLSYSWCQITLDLRIEGSFTFEKLPKLEEYEVKLE